MEVRSRQYDRRIVDRRAQPRAEPTPTARLGLRDYFDLAKDALSHPVAAAIELVGLAAGVAFLIINHH